MRQCPGCGTSRLPIEVSLLMVFEIPYFSKIHQVGPGNQQLAKKRVWAIKEDERMAKKSRGSTNNRQGLHQNSIETFLLLSSTASFST